MFCRSFFILFLLFTSLITSRSEAASIDTTAYLKIYLTSSDLPNMKNDQSNTNKGADRDDPAFNKYHGEIAGMNLWNRKGADTIERIVDIHWVFPDAESAKAYLNETWAYHAEWGKPIDNAPKIGDMSRAYGVTMKVGDMAVVQYYYLFQVGRVVSKLFVAQGAEFKTLALTLGQAQQLAQKIVGRIHQSGF